MIGLRREANERERSGAAKKVAKDASGAKNIDRIISRRGKNLVSPTLGGEGKSVTLENTHTSKPWTIVDEDGKPASGLTLTLGKATDETRIELVPTVDGNSLWAPDVRYTDDGSRYVVLMLSTSHEWFVRAYAPLGHDSTGSYGIAMLLYALALAEMNNVKEDFIGELEEFRNQVSRSLKELARDLPEHNPDD